MRSFGEVMFTDSVKAEQDKVGTRDRYETLYAKPRFPEISDREKQFIETRQTAYIATVSETGWPYVQHRGGPTGFLKVLGPERIAFADYPGNNQFVSAGAISGGQTRMSMILVDYPRQARLKIQALARLDEDADLVSTLVAPEGVSPSRAMVLDVQTLDWNCPKYIVPRYSETELQELIGPKMQEMANRIAQLEAELASKG